MLSLDTLRCLAQSMPEYPMPPTDKLPTTHITKSKAPRAPSKRKPRVWTAICSDGDDSSENDDSSEDEEDDDEEEDDDDSSEDDDDEPADDDGDDEEDDEEDDKEEDSEMGSGGATANALSEEVETDALDEAPPTLASGTLVKQLSVEDIKEGSLRFLFMGESSEPEYRDMEFPVGLVFVRAVQGKRLQAYWFQRQGGRKDFDPRLKFQTYAKWWNDPKWLRKLKLKRNQSPKTEQIFDNWFTSLVDIDTVVSVEIPAALYNPPKVVQNDTLKLPTEFITKTLLPVCKATFRSGHRIFHFECAKHARHLLVRGMFVLQDCESQVL